MTLPVVYSESYLTYDFGPGHPFTPLRVEILSDLLGYLDADIDRVRPGPADTDDLYLVHRRDFVEAVISASIAAAGRDAISYGLGTSDVPIFSDMHDATLALVGGTLHAGNLLLNGERRVLQLGGGLHHATAARAAGFCVYNDVALLNAHLAEQGLRVAYLDIDVHHGDGVQWIHYADDRVMTISLHESGYYLFPGTGFIDEIGREDGEGYCVNVPLEPGTGHESYLEVFSSIVPDALSRFKPDVIVLETGADAHYSDPLAHLSLNTATYWELFRLIRGLAADHAYGRLIATLGGGYNIDATVRIWAMLVLALSETETPERLPDEWRNSWKSRKGIQLSTTLSDDLPALAHGSEKEAHAKNLKTLDDLRSRLGW